MIHKENILLPFKKFVNMIRNVVSRKYENPFPEKHILTLLLVCGHEVKAADHNRQYRNYECNKCVKNKKPDWSAFEITVAIESTVRVLAKNPQQAEKFVLGILNRRGEKIKIVKTNQFISIDPKKHWTKVV